MACTVAESGEASWGPEVELWDSMSYSGSAGPRPFLHQPPKEGRRHSIQYGSLCPFPIVLSVINHVTGQPHCLLGLLQRQCGPAGGRLIAYTWCNLGPLLGHYQRCTWRPLPWLVPLSGVSLHKYPYGPLSHFFFIFTQKLPNEVSLAIPSKMLTFPPPPMFYFPFPALFFSLAFTIV